MKKLFRLALIVLIGLLCTRTVYGSSDHVVIEEYQDYLTSAQYKDLNEDLERVRKNYDIDLYFIYDTSIGNSENAVRKYADDLLAREGSCTNNVAIVVSSDHYCIEAQGSAEDIVEEHADAIWSRFYKRASMISSSDPNAFYEGIRESYQYVIELINNETYQSNAPVSELKALVNDYANILTDSEEQKLNQRLQQIKDKYGFDAVIVTTDSYNGMDVSDYADDFYDYSQYGKDGVLLVWNTSEPEIYISTTGKGYDYFTDYGIDLIFDDMTDDLINERYYDAFMIYADRVDEYIRDAEKGDIVDIDTNVRKPGFSRYNVIISEITAAISSMIAALSLKGRMRNTTRQHGARNYVVRDSFYLNGASDMLVNRHVTRTMRPRNNSQGHSNGPSGHSMGGGSHIHTSSSGTSHGGHGRHF